MIQSPGNSTTGDLPMVTVIMPVRNEAAFISVSLGAVLAQDYPRDRMEVIVADGMSGDGTREIVRSFRESGADVRLIDNVGKIVPTGLNAAIREARGDVIVRVDGHCKIASDYVSRCVAHLTNQDIDCVGGPLDTVGETFMAEVIAAAMSSPFGVGGSAFRTVNDKAMLTDTVAFPAFTRSIVDRGGPFDEELVRNQDDEYNYRLRKLGARILLSPDVRSNYYSRSSFSSLWRQYFFYGFWKVRVMQKHFWQMRARQFVPSAFVVALLISLAAASLSEIGMWLLGLVLGAYIAANFGAAVLTAGKMGWRLLPLLPLAFATIHLAYGLGFLVGLIRFWNRWGDRETRIGGYSTRMQEPGV